MASQQSATQGDDGPTFASPVDGTLDYPNYEADADLFQKFLQQHTIRTAVNDDGDSDLEEEPVAESDLLAGRRVVRQSCYLALLQGIRNRRYTVVQVPLDELVAWDAARGMSLAERVSKNTARYSDLFQTVFDKVLEGLQPQASAEAAVIRDPVEILHQQRMAQQAEYEANRNQNQNAEVHNHYAGAGNLEQEQQEGQDVNALQQFPPQLLRRYELRILPLGRKGTLEPFENQYFPPNAKQQETLTPVSLRTVRSNSLGRLVTVRGMVVRSSDVKPSCVVATYSCDACGVEVYQITDKKREFVPVRSCPNCPSKAMLVPQTRGSKFVKFQELKLQELPSQVPMGHVPRSLRVYCRGELTRQAVPGDVIDVDGIFLPQRIAESGMRMLKAGLLSTTYLEAQNIAVQKQSYDESAVLSQEEAAQMEVDILQVAGGEDPIGRLSASIAPEIFGHDDIKRALLLQLVSGCTRTLDDGMKIRGDINICLMGDPGVAKSQLLKHVASIAPRGVYTTGKGSSGVGLTAAVTKDMTTGEMALEGGALVLADRGICCIDEFDKMDDSDRTAIHEVMEQQTCSIAKAGIVATLNARTAVLAAANPLYGRYNRNKSLSENVNLPNSLLSRFDLMYLVLDTPDVDRDMALARHVTFVHQNVGVEKRKDDTDDEETGASADHDGGATVNPDIVPPKVLREYIARARTHRPVMPPDVAPYVTEAYVALRMQDRPSSNSRYSRQSDQTVITPRQLLSILRLSQALARLRFSDFVACEDVDEAIRLTHTSKASLTEDQAGRGEGRRGEDVMSRIFHIIRDYANASDTREVELKLCEAMVLRKGFTAQQLQTCLEEYEALNVIQINHNRTHVYFL